MRIASLRRDEDGLPLASPLEERAAKIIVAIATVFFALAAAWEIGGPILAGHYASSASVGIIAENMWKWGIAGPVWEYTTVRPSPAAYYCHHPWGIFWTTALLMKVFGRHDYVCRLAPVLLSAFTPLLLYKLGRAMWRPIAGATAALGFVVLPISLSFASFNALEVPVIAWTLLGLFGYVRFLQTYRPKYGALAVFGFLLAMHADWQPYILVAELLAVGLIRLYLLRRKLGPLNERRYAALWIALATSAVVTFALYLVLFMKAGKLVDLLASYSIRTAGQETPLSSVLASRRYWIELSFTPVAVVIGKIAAVVCVFRLILSRRETEVVPLAYLGMATVQYVVFKQGADVHVFWPHTFAAYFALGLGALATTLIALVESALSALRKKPEKALSEPRPAVPLAVFGALLLPLALILRDALPTYLYARETGGRFDEHGRWIDTDGATTAFLHWLSGRIPRKSQVDLHEGMRPTWAQVWALGGRVVGVNRPLPLKDAPPRSAPYLVDTRFLPDSAQADLASRFRVVAVGPFWQVDRTMTAPIEAYSIVETEPSLATFYFISGTEPVRTIVPDPFLTWELRAHFGQPTDPVSAPATTFEQRRIQHNMAVASGDAGRAKALFAEIEATLSPPRARFDDGTELVGIRFEDGAAPVLVLMLRAAGPTAKDVQLTVQSRVTARALLSTTMADPKEREVGLPLGIAPERWKRGFLYSDRVPIRKRPGREVFEAAFWSRRRGPHPRLVNGQDAIEVLALP